MRRMTKSLIADREMVADLREAARLITRISLAHKEDPDHTSWNAFELRLTAEIKEAQITETLVRKGIGLAS